MTQAYKEQPLSGRRFVHVRKKHSSNRDLRALKGATSKKEDFSIDLQNKELKGDRIGIPTDSVVTNSAHPADVVKESNCKTCGDVEDARDGGNEEAALECSTSSIRAAQLDEESQPKNDDDGAGSLFEGSPDDEGTPQRQS